MKIVIGPDAPTLEEQGLGIVIDCETYQEELDHLYTAMFERTITTEQAEAALNDVANRVSTAIDEVVKRCRGPFIVSANYSDLTH